MAGAQCCDNAPTLNPSGGVGIVEDFGGLKTYISGPPDSKFSILLVADVFGFEAPNLRKLADKIGAAGFLVVVPDFLYGEPLDRNNPNKTVQAWLADHPTDKAAEDAKPVIEALRNKGVSKIGAAGFCWGGEILSGNLRHIYTAKIVVELAKHAHYIDATVLLHPSFVTLDDIQEIKVPISILGAETDHITPPELIKQFDETLKAKSEVDSFVKIYLGVSHGWAVRYNSDDEEAVKHAEEAHKDTLDWFGKYIR